MQRIVVTGANKGIGLAIAEKVLERPNTYVYLGARDRSRGEVALRSIVEKNPGAAGRAEVLTLDVLSDASVAEAAATVAAHGTIYGLVNNAGGMLSTPAETLELNLFSQIRVTDAFRGCLDPAGSRVVFVSSGSGPMAAAKCSASVRARLTNPAAATPADVTALAQEFLAAAAAPPSAAPGAVSAVEAAGFPPDSAGGSGTGSSGGGGWGAYGVSKALLNMYVLGLGGGDLGACCLANACSPGMIATDLLTAGLAALGKTPEEAGALPPAAGTVAPLALLFGDVGGRSGCYYGSDGLRSPMGAYRSPGTPAYDGPDA